MTSPTPQTLQALSHGRLATPFDVLGPHQGEEGAWMVRVWAPGAKSVSVVREGRSHPTERASDVSLFTARLDIDDAPGSYRVLVDGAERDDPYRLGPVRPAAEYDRLSRPDGRVHVVLGAHTMVHEGLSGTAFSVWAPQATAVTLTGTFNHWSEAAHPMQARGESGVWELFVPGVEAGALYKYRIVSPLMKEPMLKADPCGRAMQLRPSNASVVTPPSAHEWTDDAWIAARPEHQSSARPTSIYEVHLGSWKREPGAKAREGLPGWKNYRQLAEELIPYVAGLGFTHIELLPITEHPYDRSWGYQTVGYFAPTARHGTGDDLRYFIDKAHAAGIGVILDWVPAHFPRDPHGLGRFDGSHLYEHADPRKGVHPDWGTYIFNYTRAEVVAFLVSSALYWIEEFHIDGLRLDAVASMLYLDYSRDEGQWVPNEHGGRENLEATRFLRTLTDTIHAAHHGVVITAEESTAWQGVTHGTDRGGLGFDLKWNMGWMHDTLEVMQADPLFRGGQYEKLTFAIAYAFSERFLLALSHDEVVHLKGSMLRKMQGSVLDKFASLRLLYGYMWTHPGKKLLFMGGELGTWNEWDDEGELDWPLLDEPMHAGISAWIAALNAAYTQESALHEADTSGDGFEWIDCHDRARTTLAYLRWSRDWKDHLVVVCNFTPVAWEGYRIAVPFPGAYEVVLDSGAEEFGGAGALQSGTFATVPEAHLGRDQHIELTLPSLTALVLRRVANAAD